MFSTELCPATLREQTMTMHVWCCYLVLYLMLLFGAIDRRRHISCQLVVFLTIVSNTSQIPPSERFILRQPPQIPVPLTSGALLSGSLRALLQRHRRCLDL